MSIVRAERRRLFKRRFTKYMILVGIVILAAIAAGVFFTNSKPGPETLAAAQAQADRQYEDSIGYWNSRGKAECEASMKANPDTSKMPVEEVCRGPRKEDFQAEWYMPSSFDFKDEFPAMITVWAAIMGLITFVIGASFVGAEWNSGGMMNLLLWRPKRSVVLSAKLGSLIGGAVVWSLAIGAVWTAALWFVATVRGTTTGMTSGTWQSFGLMGLRGLGLALTLGIIGFTLATLGRHTAMALGVAAAVIVVFQFGVGIVLNLAGVRWVEAYLLPTHMIAWMDKEYIIEDYQSCNFSSGECKPETLTLTWVNTGTVMAIIIAVLVGLSYWNMSRRDVA
ncbi:ABC-type transport system involved in multi-copper enzyme maturation permease subunit [Allocatelliglobosispora scoriae]|uniref:ABC-type transport system involved in multi-copper enzyme maturation permease subunit n=1 Tax=Allocatelliglobosispora scoriae TaxID=643052 RepID=A0A841BTC5_9ACTN|nr:ABC transporter permease subunit [Allocatelliglobosispora scoriae]MBB5870678.1 ABC-type transport system involved in multi-copper enzyme maturation permease subunit [Allocatelliglobosispora scoriae]